MRPLLSVPVPNISVRERLLAPSFLFFRMSFQKLCIICLGLIGLCLSPAWGTSQTSPHPLDLTTTPSSATPQVFYTRLGGQIRILANGTQKYHYQDVLKSLAYRSLSIGESLQDEFFITFKETNQKFFYVVILTRTPNFDKPRISGKKLLLLKETPLGGIVFKDKEGVIGYYAGDIIKSPIYHSLAPGKKIYETFCINARLCHLVVEIAKPLDSAEKPEIKALSPPLKQESKF